MTDQQIEEDLLYAEMRGMTPGERLKERMALKAYAKKAKRAFRRQQRLRDMDASQGVVLTDQQVEAA